MPGHPGAVGLREKHDLKSIAGIIRPDEGRVPCAMPGAARGRVLYDSPLKINEKPR